MPDQDRITSRDITIVRGALRELGERIRGRQALAQGIEDDALALACGRQRALLDELDEFLEARRDIADAISPLGIRVAHLTPGDREALRDLVGASS
ncbi:MAG: hypothetical protein AUG49_16020 [Catenulispora sp. 13_1_20CM_3_70_7]|nr:MAG: hypothetical protein AUG49_16020 [Catenulispora sp. 13_1_20CM_3_70_7]